MLNKARPEPGEHRSSQPDQTKGLNLSQASYTLPIAKHLMGVHRFFWFVWEGVVVELAGR